MQKPHWNSFLGEPVVLLCAPSQVVSWICGLDCDWIHWILVKLGQILVKNFKNPKSDIFWVQKCLLWNFEKFDPLDQILMLAKFQNFVQWVKIFKISKQAFLDPKYVIFGWKQSSFKILFIFQFLETPICQLLYVLFGAKWSVQGKSPLIVQWPAQNFVFPSLDSWHWLQYKIWNGRQVVCCLK